MLRVLKILVIILLSSLATKSQFTGIYIKPNNSYGIIWNRGRFDSTFFYATYCGVPAGTAGLHSNNQHMSALYFDSCGHKLYVFDPSDSSWSATGSTTTASNGLTKTGSDIKLGGAFTQNNTWSSSDPTYRLTLNGVNAFADGPLYNVFTNGSNGIAIQGESDNGRGVYGFTNTGFGLWGNANSNGIGITGSSISGYGGNLYSTSGVGLQASSGSNTAIIANIIPSSTNNVAQAIEIIRSTSGTPANGIGVSIDLANQSSVQSRITAQLISKLTDVTDATYTSSFEFWNAYNATLARKAMLAGTGQWTWDGYPALSAETDTSAFKPIGINGSGVVGKMTNWIGSGGGLLNAYSIGGNVTNSTAPIISLHYSVYNVLDFGLVCDSVTDNTTALRALIALIPDGASLYFPGTGKGYYFADSIVVDRSLNIYGDGSAHYKFYVVFNQPQKGATNLFFGSNSKNFLVFKASATNLNPVINLHDLSIFNGDTTSNKPSGAGITIADNIAGLTLRNITVGYFNTDVKIRSGNYITFENSSFIAPWKYAIDLGNIGAIDLGVFKFNNCNIFSGYHNSGDSLIGIIYRGGGYADISHCHFNAQGVYVYNSEFKYQLYTTYEQGQTSDLFITNNLFENYKVNAMRFTNTGGSQPIYSIKALANMCSPFNNGNQAYNAIYVDGPFKDITFMDNSGHSLQSTPTVSPFVFLKVNNCTQLKILEGGQEGWTAYDSVTNSTANQHVVLNPTNFNANTTAEVQINNDNTGSSALAALHLKTPTSDGYLYMTNSSYPFGASALTLRPLSTGHVELWSGSGAAFTVANNGHSLFNTATDHSRMFNLNGGAWINKDSFPISSATSLYNISVDTVTGNLVRSAAVTGGVSSFAFTNGSGFTGTVTNATTTPTLALTTSLTTGSVPFIGASGVLSEDNTNFFWDNTNKRLGIGTNTPAYALNLFKSANSTVAMQFENSNNGTASAAAVQLKAGSNTGYLYYTSAGYTTYPNYLISQNPTGDFMWYGAAPIMILKNNGHALIGTTTDGGQTFQVTGTSYHSGESNFGNATDQGAYTIQNTGGLYQNGAFNLRTVTAPPSTYNLLVHGLTDSNVYQIPSSTFINSVSAGTGITTSAIGGAVTVSVDINSSNLFHVLAQFLTDANNTSTTETDLYSTTIAANKLNSNGQSLQFEYTGTLNDITATADIQLYFAGTSFGNTGALTVSATGAWSARGMIIRTTSTTARAYVTMSTPGASTASYTNELDLTGLDFTTTNILKITGQAGGAGGGSSDITGKFGKIIFQPIAQ